MKHFCEELKAAREFKKVRLEDISATTKINVTFLQALEDGRWDILPEPYIKGFLRAYAQCVGMNVLKVLKKYDELEKGVKSEGAEVPEEEQKLAPPAPPPPPVKSRFPAVKVRTYGLLYGGVVVAIIAVGAYILFRPNGETSEQSGQAPGAESQSVLVDTSVLNEVPPDTLQASLTDSTMAKAAMPGDTSASTLPVPTEAVAGSPSSSQELFVVTAVFNEPCYVEVVEDAVLSTDYLFQAGQTKTWRPTRSLWLKIGNAGGTRLSLNGSDLGVLGSTNQVVTLSLGPEGVREKTLGPVPTAGQRTR